jgi:hypothetical protein
LYAATGFTTGGLVKGLARRNTRDSARYYIRGDILMDKESVKNPVELKKMGVLRALVATETKWRYLFTMYTAAGTEIRVNFCSITVLRLRVTMISLG